MYIGDTICIDSCWYQPYNIWKWSLPGGVLSIYPDWDGPYCWEIVSPGVIDPDVTLFYTDITPPDTFDVTIPYAWVEVYDDRVGDDTLLKTVAGIDEYGHFTVDNFDNSTDPDGLDIYFRVYANATPYVQIVDDNSNPKSWQTCINWDIADGSHTMELTCPEDSSSQFFVLDKIIKATDKWNLLRPNDNMGLTGVKLDKYGSDKYCAYVTGLDIIYINDSLDVANGIFQGSWTEDDIIHEFGHRIEFINGFFDSIIPLVDTAHGYWETLSPEFAVCEGFADIWSAFVRNDPVLVKYGRGFSDSAWADFETGEWGRSYTFGTFNTQGVTN